MHNIFVYGTLQSPEIVKKLTGKSFKTSVAVLHGFKLYSVKDRDYPAIIEQNDAETTGLILENVDDPSLDIILFYEGDEYEKKKVTVLTDEKPEKALAFIWRKEFVLLVEEEWDFQEFEKNSLEHSLDVVIPDSLEEFYKK